MTENLLFIKPDTRFLKEIKLYQQAFTHTENGIEGTSFLTSFAQPEDWLAHLSLFETKDTLPSSEYVPSMQFILIRGADRKILGMANLRLELNEYLLKFGGNIGYSIVPSERRKGYGTIILTKTLQQAKLAGLTKLLVTCREENIGSSKIIEVNNGSLENKLFNVEEQQVIRRYWITNLSGQSISALT